MPQRCSGQWQYNLLPPGVKPGVVSDCKKVDKSTSAVSAPAAPDTPLALGYCAAHSPALRFRDYVKKVALYRDHVAVQLPTRVVLYALDSSADDMDMQYRSAGKINQQLDCNLLVVASNHILLCQVSFSQGGVMLYLSQHQRLDFVLICSNRVSARGHTPECRLQLKVPCCMSVATSFFVPAPAAASPFFVCTSN